MTDYSQPAAVTQRVRFFTGQLLEDQDFVDEQHYHVDRVRRLGRLLGFTGVAEGLDVSVVDAKRGQLSISAGTAVDSLGRQLVLPDSTTLTVPPGSVDFAQNVTVTVVIAYHQAEADVAVRGGLSARRFDETPIVAAVTATGKVVAVAPADAPTPLDPETVRLARVGGLADGGVRTLGVTNRTAGLKVGGLTVGGLTVGGLTVSGNIGIGANGPENHIGLPDRAIDMYGANEARLSLRSRDIEAEVSVHTAVMQDPGVLSIGTVTPHDLNLRTNNEARLTVNKDGDVICHRRLFLRLPDDKLAETPGYYALFGKNARGDFAEASVWSKRQVLPSDARLKESLTELTDAAAHIEQLRGVTFTWNDEGLAYLTRFVDDSVSAGPGAGEEADRRARDGVRRALYPALSRPTIGVVAQEVEAVLPELVSTGEDGVKQVDYTMLSAVLVQAVKEQQAAIRTLTARLDALTGPDARDTARPVDSPEN